MPLHAQSLVFDFDGTLIQNGPLNSDKGVHILFSSWYACRRTALRRFIEAQPQADAIEHMVRAYVRYPGAPRFEQFSAVVNALVNRQYHSVPTFEGFGIGQSYADAYAEARQIYNRIYSALNDAAAEHFWRPYPSVKAFLSRMAAFYDLRIASGVTQDILETDFRRHGFDAALFASIHGGNTAGGNDKGAILQAIKRLGYREVLFIADSNKDLEYARTADVRFYRIRTDADFQRLNALLPGPLPNETAAWDFQPEELDFFRRKTADLVAAYQDADVLPFVELSRWVNR